MTVELTAADVAAWRSDLVVLTGGLGWMFTRPEPRETFSDLIGGLLADVGRKNSWQLAEFAGHGTAQPMEHLLNGAKWDADVLRDEVRCYVVEHLGDADAVLVLDDTQVIKKGRESVGVAPQYCGLTGQTENCQSMVMLTYAAPGGHTFIDRELYLPASWTDDAPRCARAGVPAGRGFATKPELGQAMLARAVQAGVPFGWVAFDAGYGRDTVLRGWCRDQRLSYVAAVPCDLSITTAPAATPQIRCVQDLIGRVRVDAWQETSAGEGSKGRRVYDWAAIAVTVKGEPPAEGFAHTVLIRRSVSDRDDVEFFLVHAPAGTPVNDMIKTAGIRWKIEENNQQGKDLLGLDQYQVRKWTPWYRHVTCCMLAAAFLTITRAKLGKDHPPKASDGSSATPSLRSATSSPGSS